MPTIYEITNVLEPDRGKSWRFVPEGYTPRLHVNETLGTGNDFEHPTVLEVNGVEYMRADWDKIILMNGDVAIFRRLPAWTAVVSAISSTWFQTVVTLASFAVSMTGKPDFSDRDKSPTQFNLAGQQNLNKLGQPIQSLYGKHKIFPPYAAHSYTRIINNDQYLYQLFCVGQGSYTLSVQQIEDTPIANFEEITSETYLPGESVTLFPDNIVTSDEVAGIELFAPDDDDYAGETGPFVANAANTDADILEWDVNFPNGLHRTSSDGDLRLFQVDITFSYREIDDAGSPLGSWVPVYFSKNLATDTPQRFTVSTTVTPGRYEVKAVRTSDTLTNPSLVDKVLWQQLRAQLPSTKDYGDVTLVAMVSKATNNLNSSSQNRFNLVAERMLEIWNGSTWSARTITRSPVWAFVDILKASYGGNLPDSKVYLSQLLTLDAIYSSRNDTFDWVFDRKTTIYKALETVAVAGRAKTVQVGNKFSLIRDEPKTVHTSAFSPENMKANTFTHFKRLQKAGDYTGKTVTYMDAQTWTEETVDCLIGSDSLENTEKLVIPGITNRNKAFREGLYIRAKEVFQRDSYSFDTGPEGRDVVFGDLVAIGHDTQFHQTGQVESIGVDNRTVTLIHPLENTHGDRIGFRDKYGAVDGPYACTVDPSELYTVTTKADITGDFLFNDDDEPPVYFFGTASDLYTSAILVEKTSNRQSQTESLSLVGYDERVYQYDNYVATPLVDAPIPEAAPDLPAVTNLEITVSELSTNIADVTWDIVAGAQYYLIQISYDNVSWSTVQARTVNYDSISISIGTIYVRVAAVNAGQGPWTAKSTTIGLDVLITSDGDTAITSEGDTIVLTQ